MEWHPGRRPPPPDTLLPPPQYAKPARKSARSGVGDRPARPDPPHSQPVGSGPRSHAPNAQASPKMANNPKPGKGGTRPGSPPPPPSKPNRARDQGRTRGGAQISWHAQAKDRREIPEGQPDRARRLHRPPGMAYQQAPGQNGRDTHSAGNAGLEGGNGEDTKPGSGPNPPEPAASAANTGTGHCTRQGSCGAPRHASAPRLGSLRASPRGTPWRQASSTGPVAPVPRATTH